MTDAYRCDKCRQFDEGDPTLSLTVKIEGDDIGLLGNLFGAGDGPSETFDFCSLRCAESFNLDPVRDDLVSDVDANQQLVETELQSGNDFDPTEAFYDE